MESNGPKKIPISDPVNYPSSYIVVNQENGDLYEVIVDKFEEEFLSITDFEYLLSPSLGAIQIFQSFLSPSVKKTEWLSCLKYAQPLSFTLKSIVSLNVDKYFKKMGMMDIETINLASQLSGSSLFNEVQELVKINANDFYLFLKQKEKTQRLSRNNPKISLKLEIDAVLYVKPIRRGKIQIFVKPLNAEKFAVNIGEETTVAELKEIIDIEQNIPCDLVKIIFQQNTLSDDANLVGKGVQHGSELDCFRDNRAKQECQGILSFVDISKEGVGTTYAITNEKASMWRIVKPGLCIEGKCSNKACEAFKEYVVINAGFGIVDVALDREKNTCPCCGQTVLFEICGFNNCVYEFIGIKYKDQKCVPVRTAPVRVGHEYRRFDMTEDNKVDWGKLQIVTRDLNEPEEVCLLCKKQVFTSDSIAFSCKHKIHTQCIKVKITKCFSCAPLNEDCNTI